MKKINLVEHNLGAEYSKEVLYFNLKKVDWYAVESQYQNYPLCVNFAVNGQKFRVRKDDWFDIVKDKK